MWGNRPKKKDALMVYSYELKENESKGLTGEINKGRGLLEEGRKMGITN